jgi:hypothetical protein
MSNTVIDTKTGRSFDIIETTEVGPNTARYGWTHSLTLFGGRKYYGAVAVIDNGEIVRMSAVQAAYK